MIRIWKMKPLGELQRRIVFGGAARAKSAGRARYTPGAKKEASSLTKLNNGFYTAGQMTIAAVSVAEHLNYSIPKLISAVNGDEASFQRHERKGVKQLRPSFRFSRDYWNSSISYGASPWYF